MRMFKSCYILFLLLSLASCVSSERTANTDCCESGLKKDFTKYSVRKLGKEYQRMKQNPEKCCEEYKSDYQNLLTTLCERLGKAGVDSCCVVKIMGAADANEVPSQYGVFCSGNEKIMIYWWRHWHDFIYFISEKGKIKQAKWFNAYE